MEYLSFGIAYLISMGIIIQELEREVRINISCILRFITSHLLILEFTIS